MNLKYILFISTIMLILTLPAISACDVNETVMEDESIFESYMDEQIIESYYYEIESNVSENEIIHEDTIGSNESDDYRHIEYHEEYVKDEYEHISYTNYSNESIDNQEEIDSVMGFKLPTFNLDTFHEIDVEIHIFMASYDDFRFYESKNLFLLILDVNLFFDNAVFKDLDKDVIICAKKIKGDYAYSIDNSISGNSFSLNILSYFNSFSNSHSNKNSICSFYLKTLNGENNEI